MTTRERLTPENEERLLCEAVDAFAERMKQKLITKRRNCWHGWRQKRFIEDKYRCMRSLQGHVMRLVEGDHRQAVDVANFCMFLDHYWSQKETEA